MLQPQVGEKLNLRGPSHSIPVNERPWWKDHARLALSQALAPSISSASQLNGKTSSSCSSKNKLSAKKQTLVSHSLANSRRQLNNWQRRIKELRRQIRVRVINLCSDRAHQLQECRFRPQDIRPSLAKLSTQATDWWKSQSSLSSPMRLSHEWQAPKNGKMDRYLLTKSSCKSSSSSRAKASYQILKRTNKMKSKRWVHISELSTLSRTSLVLLWAIWAVCLTGLGNRLLLRRICLQNHQRQLDQLGTKSQIARCALQNAYASVQKALAIQCAVKRLLNGTKWQRNHDIILITILRTTTQRLNTNIRL